MRLRIYRRDVRHQHDRERHDLEKSEGESIIHQGFQAKSNQIERLKDFEADTIDFSQTLSSSISTEEVQLEAQTNSHRQNHTIE